MVYHRFGNPDPDFMGDRTFTAKPANGVHYVDGNLTIGTGNCYVLPNETIVVLVNGNLTVDPSRCYLFLEIYSSNLSTA